MTTKELLALVVSVMLLAGCHSVTPAEIATAERVCATFGGPASIPAQWGSRDRLAVYCNDGTSILTNNAAKEPK